MLNTNRPVRPSCLSSIRQYDRRQKKLQYLAIWRARANFASHHLRIYRLPSKVWWRMMMRSFEEKADNIISSLVLLLSGVEYYRRRRRRCSWKLSTISPRSLTISRVSRAAQEWVSFILDWLCFAVWSVKIIHCSLRFLLFSFLLSIVRIYYCSSIHWT